MSLPKITDATFDDITSKDTVLVKATAKWCSPCQVMNPVLDEVQKDMDGQITMYDLDIEESPIVPTRIGVRGIPALFIYKSGKLAGTKVGAISKTQLVEFIEQSIKD